MTQKEIIDVIEKSVGKKVRITFGNGVVESVEVGCGFDGEGFLCSGPEGGDPQAYWVRIDEVTHIENAA